MNLFNKNISFWVFKRFPIPLIVASIIGVIIPLQHNFSGLYRFRWDHLLFVFLISFPLTIAIRLIQENRNWPNIFTFGTSLASIIGLVVSDIVLPFHISTFLYPFTFSCLFFILSPYLLKKNTTNADFIYFFEKIIKAALSALWSTIPLVIIYFIIKHSVGTFIVTLMILVRVSYLFLSLLFNDLQNHHSNVIAPYETKGFKLFLRLLSVLCLTAFYLIAFSTDKFRLLTEIISVLGYPIFLLMALYEKGIIYGLHSINSAGSIAGSSAFFLGLSFFIYILIVPLSQSSSNSIFQWFLKAYPYFLIYPLLLEVYQISEYLKNPLLIETAYFHILISIWFGLNILYMISKRTWISRFAISSLACLFLFASLGPLSLKSIACHSYEKYFAQFAHQHNLLENGKLKVNSTQEKEAKELLTIIKKLVDFGQHHRIASYFPENSFIHEKDVYKFMYKGFRPGEDSRDILQEVTEYSH